MNSILVFIFNNLNVNFFLSLQKKIFFFRITDFGNFFFIMYVKCDLFCCERIRLVIEVSFKISYSSFFVFILKVENFAILCKKMSFFFLLSSSNFICQFSFVNRSRQGRLSIFSVSPIYFSFLFNHRLVSGCEWDSIISLKVGFIFILFFYFLETFVLVLRLHKREKYIILNSIQNAFYQLLSCSLEFNEIS